MEVLLLLLMFAVRAVLFVAVVTCTGAACGHSVALAVAVTIDLT